MRRTGVWVFGFRKLCHPPNLLWILAATPGSQNLRDLRRQTTGFSVLSLSSILFGFGFSVGLVYRSLRSIINIDESGHRHGRRINSTSILSFSSLTTTWCCCSRWRRRARRRCRTMPLLSWRCHSSWKMRTGGRTRWQAWNHDRNEVLHVTLYPNPVWKNNVVFDRWSTHVSIRVRRKAFRAIILLACFRGLSLSRKILDIHNRLFMRLHFTIGGYDYRRTARFRQSIHFSIIQVLFADHMHRRSGFHNKFSFLWFKSWCKQAPIFRRWEEYCSFMLLSFQHILGKPARCFTGTSLLPFRLLLRPILEFWSVGAALMRFTWANISERRILVSNLSVTRNSLCEFNTSDSFPYVWALP